MKVVIDIDDYVFDTDIDSDWVNVCNDELAESLNNAVKLSDVLRELRDEISKYRATDGHDGNTSIPCKAFNAGIRVALESIDKCMGELE